MNVHDADAVGGGQTLGNVRTHDAHGLELEYALELVREPGARTSVEDRVRAHDFDGDDLGNDSVLVEKGGRILIQNLGDAGKGLPPPPHPTPPFAAPQPTTSITKYALIGPHAFFFCALLYIFFMLPVAGDVSHLRLQSRISEEKSIVN